MSELTKISKYMCLLLRHKPEKGNLKLDSEGWTDVNALLTACINKGYNCDIERIERIVLEDEKGRYTLLGGKIRCNQGHSVEGVNISFKRKIPPIVLYHGTSYNYHDSIAKNGLLSMSRHLVHLSEKYTTAQEVGSRKSGKLMILEVDCKSMVKDGYTFYQSDNGVWLIDHVPVKYLTNVP